MRGHSERAVIALIVVLVLIAFFWSKIKAMLTPSGAVSTAVNGTPVPTSAKTLTPEGAAYFSPAPEAAPELAPGASNLGANAPQVSGTMSPSDVAAYTPFPFSDSQSLEASGLTASDLAEINAQSFPEG